MPPRQAALKATVPPSLMDRWPKPIRCGSRTIVVIGPPLPVKIPLGPVSRSLRKATVPLALMEGYWPKLPIPSKGPLLSAMVVIPPHRR
jgi:hypothetical protein